MRRRVATCERFGCKHLRRRKIKPFHDSFRYGGPHYAFQCLLVDPQGTECHEEWFESHRVSGACPYVAEYAVSQGENDAEQASVQEVCRAGA